MPGRATHRAIGSSTTSASRKSSARSTSDPPSLATAPVHEAPPSQLRRQVCAIFADAQHTTASHRKLIINLGLIREACCYELAKPRQGRKGNTNKDNNNGNIVDQSATEENFGQEIERCVLRLMIVKKSEAAGDRIVRFLGLFLKHASDKDRTWVEDSVGEEDNDLLSDTPSTRLTSRILSVLLPLLEAKEKQTRYRATQLISHIINSVDSIDDDLFQLLRLGLLKRVRDKESMVRVQAVLGLGRLAGNDMDEDEEAEDHSGEGGDDDLGSVLERLLKILQNDPSADVRRSLLLNLPLVPTTLPFLLERARDQDTITRRALYSRLLPALGDFRHLSLSMREKLLRWGLRDRDEHVRKAAARLFCECWIEDCAGTRESMEAGGKAADVDGAVAAAAAGASRSPNFEALLELLERIDIVNSGAEDGVALDAMNSFWDRRSDYRDAASFEASFWDSLSAESAFMARTFNDFCRVHSNGRYEALVEEKMPEVTGFAFYLQRHVEYYIEARKKESVLGQDNDDAMDIDDDDGDVGGRDGNTGDDTVEREFIVEQLLHIAQTLDYSDEVGRRKMLALMREMLATPDLPEEATKLVVELLHTLTGSDSTEREFCGVVLEAVAEVHDTLTTDDSISREGTFGVPDDLEDDSFHSARSEISRDNGASSRHHRQKVAAMVNGATKTSQQQTLKVEKKTADGIEEEDEEAKAIKQILINMKCLHIAQCMLENVEGPLQQNGHLVSMLNNLVVPAVRSHEAPLRERGLLCLGLCCLLDKTLAEENLTLFLHCFNKGHDALQVYALRILCDILITHGASILEHPTLDHGKPVYKVFHKGLRSGGDDKPMEVQSAACTAICKLMLRGVFTDEDLLKSLVVAYFDPATAANLSLRQALTYFLPVYCHSRVENQARMQRVVLPALRNLMLVHENLDDDQEMVGLNVIGAHLVDWTDPRKLFVGPNSTTDVVVVGPGVVNNAQVHLRLANDLLERISSSTCHREERKVLIGMINKLYISPKGGGEGSPPKINDKADKEVGEEGAKNKKRLYEQVDALVSKVLEDKLAPDVTSRNALTKLSIALRKILEAFEGENLPPSPPPTIQTNVANDKTSVAFVMDNERAPDDDDGDNGDDDEQELIDDDKEKEQKAKDNSGRRMTRSKKEQENVDNVEDSSDGPRVRKRTLKKKKSVAGNEQDEEEQQKDGSSLVDRLLDDDDDDDRDETDEDEIDDTQRIERQTLQERRTFLSRPDNDNDDDAAAAALVSKLKVSSSIVEEEEVEEEEEL